MINKVWFVLIFIGILFGIINGKDMGAIILDSASDAYKLIVNLGPLIILWSGILFIADKSGLLHKFSIL